jgi:L-fuconolactonase
MTEASRIDTHTHVASDDHTRYPIRPTDLGRQWWTEPGHDASALLSHMDEHGIDRGMLVQPIGAYGYDNQYLLDAVATHQPRLSGVPAIDVDDKATGARELTAAIRNIAETPNVAAVRFFAVAPGSSWTEDLDRRSVAFKAARDGNLPVVVTAFEPQVDHLAPVFRTMEVSVALDHCGFPELSEGRVTSGAPLLALKDVSHLALKVSTHLLLDAAKDGDPVALVTQLADVFGVDRLVWGSDYPQTGADYAGLLAIAEAAAATLSESARQLFFGGNAARVFDRSGLS